MVGKRELRARERERERARCSFLRVCLCLAGAACALTSGFARARLPGGWRRPDGGGKRALRQLAANLIWPQLQPKQARNPRARLHHLMFVNNNNNNNNTQLAGEWSSRQSSLDRNRSHERNRPGPTHSPAQPRGTPAGGQRLSRQSCSWRAAANPVAATRQLAHKRPEPARLGSPKLEGEGASESSNLPRASLAQWSARSLAGF